MRGGLKGRHIVVLAVALGLAVELPLLAYIWNRGDDTAAVDSSAPLINLGGASSLPLHPAAAKFEPDDTKLDECDNQFCFEQAYGNIAYSDGPKVAFALVERQYAGGSDPSCHRIAHVIGAASLARNQGNVARTFAEGSSTCWSGYYHGVLERAFSKVKSYDAASLGAKSREVCADATIRKSVWLSYQCLHGLGHGLMITTGYQLPLALEVCKRLRTSWDQNSCKTGVFMENVITSYGGQSPYVKDDDPLYPCNWVAQEDKYPCYQNAGTRIVRVFGQDWARVAKTCSTAEADWRLTCFGSFGQNVSVNNDRDPKRIAPVCMVARTYGGEEECLRSAAKDIVGAYDRGREAAELCELAPTGLRASCHEAIGRMFHYLRTTRATRRAACREIGAAPNYLAQCIAGTTRSSSIPGLTRTS